MGAAILGCRVPAPYSRNDQRIQPTEEHFMPAQITVIGMQREAGGLKESIGAFRKHHGEVATALLNISGIGTITGDPVDKDDPRMPYEYQEWPRMVYHGDGREVVVVDQDEFAEHIAVGFRAKPYPKPQVVVGNPAEEKKLLIDQLADRDAKLAKQNEMLLELLAWKREVEQKGAEPKKPAK